MFALRLARARWLPQGLQRRAVRGACVGPLATRYHARSAPERPRGATRGACPAAPISPRSGARERRGVALPGSLITSESPCHTETQRGAPRRGESLGFGNAAVRKRQRAIRTHARKDNFAQERSREVQPKWHVHLNFRGVPTLRCCFSIMNETRGAAPLRSRCERCNLRPPLPSRERRRAPAARRERSHRLCFSRANAHASK